MEKSGNSLQGIVEESILASDGALDTMFRGNGLAEDDIRCGQSGLSPLMQAREWGAKFSDD